LYTVGNSEKVSVMRCFPPPLILSSAHRMFSIGATALAYDTELGSVIPSTTDEASPEKKQEVSAT